MKCERDREIRRILRMSTALRRIFAGCSPHLRRMYVVGAQGSIRIDRMYARFVFFARRLRLDLKWVLRGVAALGRFCCALLRGCCALLRACCTGVAVCCGIVAVVSCWFGMDVAVFLGKSEARLEFGRSGLTQRSPRTQRPQGGGWLCGDETEGKQPAFPR
jgi:hypothetical protein